MAVGAPQSIDYVGTNIAFNAAAALDFATGGERQFLWMKNGSGVSTTVTISIPGTTFEQANPDVATVIPAGQERMIGPLNPDLRDPGTSNLVVFVVSPTASVTGAIVELPSPPPGLPI